MHTTTLLARPPLAWRDLLQLREDGDLPLYRRISDATREAIDASRLRPGMRLPAERELARQLAVSRATIVAAYDELESCGVIRRQVGRGTFICARESTLGVPFAWEGKLSARYVEADAKANRGVLAHFTDAHRPLARDASMISFAAALPALDALPVSELRELTEAALSGNPVSASPLGHSTLREAIASRMGAAVERVLIVSSAQEAFHLIGRCLTDRKDVVVADDPGSIAFRRALHGLGCTTVSWRAPSWDIDALEDTIVRHKPRLVGTSAIFQDPTTRSMSRDQRHDLIELATRYRLPIVEDITSIDLAFRPTQVHTLGRIAADPVIQVGTFSSTLGPNLGLGFVIAPPVLVTQVAAEKERVSSFSSGLSQFIVGEMMRRGLYDTHVERLRREHALRLRTSLSAIREHLTPDEIRFSIPDGGSFLWIRLTRRASAEALRTLAREAGVDFLPGSVFSHRAEDLSALRFCFTSVPIVKIEEGVRRLALAVKRMRARETTFDERELAVASSA